MTTPYWFPLCFWHCHWVFASFPSCVLISVVTFVSLCLCPCLSLWVCGLSHCLIIAGLCRQGYHLVFHCQQWSFHRRQLETCGPSLFCQTLLPPLWLFRPQLQQYLCLRHISWWCGWQKVLWCLAATNMRLLSIHWQKTWKFRTKW